MDLPQALAECADLLVLASSALKRMLRDKRTSEVAGPVEGYLDEVLEIASRLEQIGYALKTSTSTLQPQNSG